MLARFEPVAVGRAKFDLSVSVSERRGRGWGAGGIVGEIEYAADLFERGTVEGLAGRLVRLLAGAVAHPDCPIVRLELLGAEERESILAGWNATGAGGFAWELALPVCGAGGQAAGCDCGCVRAGAAELRGA